ncbi:anthrax toxin lethal factor-related metalloendopeptidase [Bacillus sp. KH172YL63]|uniref:anthrax toxin lethal factor-related metalloendopeptidase n=1 Tax=Bacillus sp. KH172YL63 TaxID=2709784 RepID=UPI0013E4E1DD|nr:toxin [Bacillus sp. KH172YL63]BCB04441.1 Pro-Pro endopeptidase [Bacillus sp. KH172YL63]
MKRISIIFVICATILLIWTRTKAEYGGIPLKHSPLKTQLILQSTHALENIILLPESPFDQEEAKDMISRLDHIPPNLLEAADRQEIKIRFFQQQLTDFSTTSHLKGVTPRGYTNENITWDNVPGIGGSKLVLVKIGHSEKGNGHGSCNLELHELAHSIDRYVLADLTYTLEFLPIWKKEAPLLFPAQPYFHQYEAEYFAEAFAMFYLNGETRNLLKKKAPATYRFFTNL